VRFNAEYDSGGDEDISKSRCLKAKKTEDDDCSNTREKKNATIIYKKSSFRLFHISLALTSEACHKDRG